MSETDVQTGDNGANVTIPPVTDGNDGVNTPLPPIILTLSCASFQGYLVQDNQVLRATYKSNVIRIDLYVSDALMAYIYPTIQRNKFTLIQEHPDMSWNRLFDWIPSTEFEDAAIDVLAKACLEAVDQPLNWQQICTALRVVLISPDLLSGGSSLKRILQGSLPVDVTYFEIMDRAIPKQIWHYEPEVTMPMCTDCGNSMRPAGSAYVCEHCGQTRPA